MKKKKVLLFLVFCLIILSILFVLYYSFQKETFISIKTSDVSLQSDVSINLIQTEEVTNLITISENELNNNKYEEKNEAIKIENDGKVVLQVEINNQQYEAIIIPYTTNGDSISSINLQITNDDNHLFFNGEYDTTLIKSQKINSKLEKVVSDE